MTAQDTKRAATAVPLWRRHQGTLVLLAAFGLSGLLGLVIVALMGISPRQALSVMIAGSLGSPRALSDTLVFMAPRLLVALGATVAIRCGIFNLGGEGQLQLGAIGAVLPATMLPHALGWLLLPISILSAAAFGAGWALLASLFRLWRGSSEVITTLMLNFIGIYLVMWLVEGPLQPAGSDFNMSAAIAPTARLPILLGGTRLHAGVLLALVAALVTWQLLYHTAFGVRLRAVGLNPRASRLQGLSVARLMLAAMAISGALGGLAGATEVLGVQYRLIEGFSGDIGFNGLAIAFLGSLEPLPVVLVAFYFGVLDSGTLALQSTLSVPAALSEIMVGLPIVILAAVHGFMLLKGRPLWASMR